MTASPNILSQVLNQQHWEKVYNIPKIYSINKRDQFVESSSLVYGIVEAIHSPDPQIFTLELKL